LNEKSSGWSFLHSRVLVNADVMSNTATQTEFNQLRGFRQQVYKLFDHRRDAFLNE
jgi:hypothetical protein